MKKTVQKEYKRSSYYTNFSNPIIMDLRKFHSGSSEWHFWNFTGQ